MHANKHNHATQVQNHLLLTREKVEHPNYRTFSIFDFYKRETKYISYTQNTHKQFLQFISLYKGLMLQAGVAFGKEDFKNLVEDRYKSKRTEFNPDVFFKTEKEIKVSPIEFMRKNSEKLLNYLEARLQLNKKEAISLAQSFVKLQTEEDLINNLSQESIKIIFKASAERRTEKIKAQENPSNFEQHLREPLTALKILQDSNKRKEPLTTSKILQSSDKRKAHRQQPYTLSQKHGLIK